MKKFDMHVHADGMEANPEKYLKEMEASGLYGGCIFSSAPYFDNKGNYNLSGLSFEDRLKQLENWTKGYEDRLFPVLWIHPDEENIIEKISIAKNAGVCAFKMICNDYYVYEEKALAVLREAARLEIPVFFHSGILWDGDVSSSFNRPVNWEALLNIEGLKFSMGHCSWPWTDECIALYGKLLNSFRSQNTAEMFFDITPGTPKIYRKELLTRLYKTGFKTGYNIMFGTDSGACVEYEYNSNNWAKKWLDTDKEILLELGVSKENIENMYCNNLMRFLGKTKEKVNHHNPDGLSFSWDPTNPEVKVIIEKWYNKLGFDKGFDAEFKRALDSIPVSDALTIEDYDMASEDGKRNLLSYLFLCEEASKKYEEKGISEDIMIDTFKDIERWCNIWSEMKSGLFLGTLDWLAYHLSFQIFKLGRLEFLMEKATEDIEKYGIKEGDDIISIHIPEGGPLSAEECKKSISMANEFFAKYFPEIKYDYYFCDSWLLDKSLKEILPEDSNILKFGEMFEEYSTKESDAILRYVFRWDAKRPYIKNMVCNSNFTKAVRKWVLEGKPFYQTKGYIKKDKI